MIIFCIFKEICKNILGLYNSEGLGFLCFGSVPLSWAHLGFVGPVRVGHPYDNKNIRH